MDLDGSGNGVHIHFSLLDAAGNAVLFDPVRPGRLSLIGAKFSAGILRHARAFTAWTAPSPVSFLRLTPNRWSAGGVFLAERNREALLRICPTSTVGGADPSHQFNLEFRAADATANPWLAMGVLIKAGLQGIKDDYEEPIVWPENVAEAELVDVLPLPASLEAALLGLEADGVVRSWFHPDLLATHLSVKRAELSHVAGLDVAEQVRRVASVY